MHEFALWGHPWDVAEFDAHHVCRLNQCETRMRDSLKSIQFLRFVAASLVVFDHSALSIEQHIGALPVGISYVAGFGGIGVHIFFVISGFIMVYTSFSEGRKGF